MKYCFIVIIADHQGAVHILQYAVCHCTLACVLVYLHVLPHRTEKDKAPPSPHLSIHSDGLVRVQNDQMLVSTCRMKIHKFPFDLQMCNLSFKSVVHSGQSTNHHVLHFSDANVKQTNDPPWACFFPLIPVKEIQLVHSPSSSETSDMTMTTQYEWLFVSMTVTNKTLDMFHLKQDMLIYTVSV